MSNFQEAKETFGKMLRWTEQPKDAAQAEKTIFIGEAVQGFYVDKRENVGQNNSSVYEILLADGQKVAFWGSDLLDGKFKEIPVNCEVRITCLGTQQPKTSKGRAYLGFKVEFDKDSVKPANLVAVGEEGTDTGTAPVTAPVPTAPTAMAGGVAPVAPVAPVVQGVAPVAPAAAPNQGF